MGGWRNGILRASTLRGDGLEDRGTQTLNAGKAVHLQVGCSPLREPFLTDFSQDSQGAPDTHAWGRARHPYCLSLPAVFPGIFSPCCSPGVFLSHWYGVRCSTSTG